ncbi:ABC transporter substrate-binding protein [Ciceribacter sp. L1K22]|uniref:ABC transporter substrate-binding protein n=1 Tax=Ciceribacter sp. L1K22 TaxID=2820275 RepID=UPI001ABE78B7|nr:ABC transporter substrate-binding protein [Ciceribacter sp. L1K22]MBO3760611.1 ABC transporter substrate-binding protein [Ciceribacter sp. L1K22]
MTIRLALTALSFLSVASHSVAEGIAVVAPQSGPYAVLGEQIRDGAAAAASAVGQNIFLVNESCEAGSGPDIAARIVEAGVDTAIGFLCSESLDGALPALAEAAIPAITVSVRWKVLMEDALKKGWPFFRLAPAPDDEAEKLVEVILANWPGSPIALIEDGTIHGRELVESVRAGLEERGLTPVFTDTFRPGQEQQLALVRRLKTAGATHVLVGGDRNDVSIIARDAAAESIPLTVIGGDAMRALDEPVPLADGVLAVALPDHAGDTTAAGALAALAAVDVAPQGYVLPAFAAVEIALAAATTATDRKLPIADILASETFQTAIGPIRFGPDHELAENPYRLLEWQNGRFVEPAPQGQ